MLLIMKAYKKFISAACISLVACQSPTDYVQVHRGNALGTTYSIQYQGDAADYSQNQKAIDSFFQVVNQSMSTYWPNSDISKINKGDDSLVVDMHFKKVFLKATQIWEATEGFFDPTVGSLVNAYGFGPQKPLPTIGEKELDSLLEITGWEKIQLSNKGTLQKESPNITIDFNAIAKGYTVDLIADYLSKRNYQNFLVEIGGELLSKGKSPKSNSYWKVAIDDPQQGEQRQFKTTISLQDEGLATSGNYRKYRIDSSSGEKYVHSLNPHTGLPVKSTILSASVRANDCMTADAYATALMVVPLEKGKALIESNPNLEAYWIVAAGEQTIEVQSKGW